MYKPPQNKNSSWTPTTVQKKGKSPSKLGRFSIQPKSNPSSTSSQEIGEYSRDSADRLTANVMRGIQAKKQEEAEGSTLQPKFESPWAPTFEPPPPLPESPASKLKGAFAPVSKNPIQPKPNPSSESSQEIGEYSRTSMDRLAANVMRSLQTREQEIAEESIQPKFESPWAPTFEPPPPLPESPASKLKGAFAPVSKNPIQRQCTECAKEGEEQKGEERKDLEEIGIQTKLTVGAPGDAYEQEADRVASQVMSMSAPTDSSASVQRQLDTNHPHHPHQIWKRAQSIKPVMQRQIDPRVQMREMIQRAHLIDGNQASGDLESRLNASKGGGSPLSENVRGFMEPRFGADFSGVRVHTGGEAVQMNQELGAQAFTHGSDVYFGQGKEPGNNELTAHELTHVVQQTGTQIQYKLNVNRPKARYPQETGIANQTVAVTVPQSLQQVQSQPDIQRSPKQLIRIDVSGRQLTAIADTGIPLYAGAITDIPPGQYDMVYCPDKKRFCIESSLPTPTTGGGILSITDSQSETAQQILNLMRTTPPTIRVPLTIHGLDTASDGTGSGTQGQGKNKVGSAIRYNQTRKYNTETIKKIQRTVGTKDDGIIGPNTVQSIIKWQEKNGLDADGKFGPKTFTKMFGTASHTIGSAVEETKRIDNEPTEIINADLTVLKNEKLANHYLQILEHYTGRSISSEDRVRAKDGLSKEEAIEIISAKPLRHMITALYTQGYREFQGASGADLAHFFGLEETIIEQFVRGNPTATHNHLKIGYGVPENHILGIAHRASGFLYYDSNGFPLPGFGGVGMRDKGYIGSEQPEHLGINIANIEDPGLRMFLNSLRQTFSDPTRMSMEAAQIYLDNVEKVNSKVQKGLSAEIKQKFEESLPFFICFLAGHGLSAFLMRVPNPTVASVGLALKGLLTAASYVMSIDFQGGALGHLLDAAYHLSRVEQNEKGELTGLSESHLQAAATPIRKMVADIALSAGTLALGKILRAVRQGKRSGTIECTQCHLKDSSSNSSKPKKPGRILRETQVGNKVIIESIVGDAPGRLNLERLIPRGVKVGLKGWERAHSQGNITGAESAKGIRYAPREVNQKVQKCGVEEFISGLNKQKAQDVTIYLTTVTETHPGTLRLKSIVYKVEAAHEGGTRTRLFEAEIEIANQRKNPRIGVDAKKYGDIEPFLKPIKKKDGKDI